MTMAAYDLPDIRQLIKLEFSEYEKQLDSVKKQSEDASKNIKQSFDRIKSAGETMSSIGKKLTIGVTTPLTLLGKGAYDTYKSVDTAFRGVAKTTDLTTQEFQALKKEIREMSKELPHTVEEISAVAEAAGQLGIKKELLTEFSETMLNIGVSTNISSIEAAQGIARFSNITGMAQEDAERFGSVLIDLGNNFATTEQEILNMSLRLAGAGSQVGLTEAEILALSTALSSVGVEAEAGGSAFSRLMSNIAVEVATGGEKVSQFARVSGMSAEEFSRAWKDKPAEALNAFIQGLGTANERGEDAIVILDEMGINEIRLRDALLRSSGASEVFSRAIKDGTRAWDENLALSKEAAMFNESEASNAKKRANEMRDGMIDLGEKVAPVFQKVSEVIADLADWFTSLDDATQETIVKFGLFAAAAGPILAIGGTVVSAIGSVGSMLAGLGSAGTVAAAGATAAGTATVGLGTAIAGATLTIAPYTLAVGAGVLAGKALYDGLTAEVIPAVDLFADHVTTTTEVTVNEFGRVSAAYGEHERTIQGTTVVISEETKAQLESFIELHTGTLEEMNNMYVGLTEINDTNIASITTSVDQMANEIIASHEKTKEESINQFMLLYEGQSSITAGEMQGILDTVVEKHDERIEKTKELRDELNRIYQGISDGSVQLTGKMQEDINDLMFQMKEESVKALSDSEIEQKIIIDRLKDQNTRVTAEMVGETVKDLIQQKEDSIKLAWEEYEEKKRVAEQMKIGLPADQQEMIDQMLADQKTLTEEQVQGFEDILHNGLYKLKEGYPDLVESVDINTGNIKGFFDDMATNLGKNVLGMTTEWDKIEGLKDVTVKFTQQNTRTFTTIGQPFSSPHNTQWGQQVYSHYNGLDAVPYDGYTARLHKGERVLTAREAANYDNRRSTSINIENFVNNREQDIQRLVDEVEFYLAQKNFGRG